jgi:hypothetical protein
LTFSTRQSAALFISFLEHPFQSQIGNPAGTNKPPQEKGIQEPKQRPCRKQGKCDSEDREQAVNDIEHRHYVIAP